MNEGQSSNQFAISDELFHSLPGSFSKPLGEQMFGCFFEILWKLFICHSACGELTVSAGKQEIFVKTGFSPSEVYISIGEGRGHTGCDPQSDGFDIKYSRGGFYLISNLSSPQRNIKWKALGC